MEEASAFAALGLEPGADSAAIEQAYKRLIKEHHPDRQGGDAKRAAEINRAYRELRSARGLKDPLELNEDWALQPAGNRAWIVVALLFVAATGLLLLAQGPLAALGQASGAGGASRSPNAAMARPDALDEPINLPEIDRAKRQELQLSRTSEALGLA